MSKRQRAEEDTTKSGPNSPFPNSGQIRSIELKNFMCHAHLKVDFGPNLNFIGGVNGSGKSAVLVAITIALGSKAGFTNRSGNLGGLVKTGCKCVPNISHHSNVIQLCGNSP